MDQDLSRIAEVQEIRRAQIEKNQAALRLIRSWAEEGDREEQSDTLRYLIKALDEDRIGQRKLFP